MLIIVVIIIVKQATKLIRIREYTIHLVSPHQEPLSIIMLQVSQYHHNSFPHNEVANHNVHSPPYQATFTYAWRPHNRYNPLSLMRHHANNSYISEVLRKTPLHDTPHFHQNQNKQKYKVQNNRSLLCTSATQCLPFVHQLHYTHIFQSITVKVC